MPRSDSNIARSGQLRDFSAPLTSLIQTRKDDRIDASNLKTAGLQQQRLQQQIDAGNQISDAQKMNLANRAILDTPAYLELLDKGNVRNSAVLGQSIMRDMADAGMDTRIIAGVVALGAENPQEAAKWMRENVMPILRTKISDGLLTPIEEGGRLVGTFNMKTQERIYFEDEGDTILKASEIQDGRVATISPTGELSSRAIPGLSAPEQETFDPVFDENANIVGQRSSLTNRVVSDPRAAAKGGEISGSQAEAAGFAVRLTDSNKIITDLESQFTGLKQRLSDIVPQGAKFSDTQRFEQATRNFINAVLRPESGAVISPEEFINAQQQYIPQPGDKPEVLEEKKRNRDVVTAQQKLQSGPAFAALVKSLGAEDAATLDSLVSPDDIPTITSQAEFDALPVGAEFIEDGQRLIKQ